MMQGTDLICKMSRELSCLGYDIVGRVDHLRGSDYVGVVRWKLSNDEFAIEPFTLGTRATMGRNELSRIIGGAIDRLRERLCSSVSL